MPRPITRRRLLASGAGAAAASLLAAPAFAQQVGSWRPTKPIRIILADQAGGGTDQVCRVFIEYMSKKFGQTVIADNKPGANGVVAATEFKNVAPDGYTLMYIVSSALMTQKVLYKNLPYDTDKDFQPIGSCPVAGLVLIVNKSTGATNLKEFVEYARKNPTSIGTYGAGSLAHIGIAAFEKNYGVSVTAVHYRGGAPMFADIAGGSIHAAIGGGAGSENVVNMGKAVAVAIQGRSRLLKMPGVPTFAELGGTERGLSLMGHTCMMAPTAMPAEIAEVYSQAMVEAGQDEATWKKFMIVGAEQRPISRHELQKWIVEEGPVWRELTAGLGIKPS